MTNTNFIAWMLLSVGCGAVVGFACGLLTMALLVVAKSDAEHKIKGGAE